MIDNVLSGVGVENMNQEILKKDEKMSDWWLGTVGLTFSPVVISVIIDLCAYGRVDFGGLIGDGELILSAFLINAPSFDLNRKPSLQAIFPFAFMGVDIYVAIP